jgi:tetratricopeptide (TPR) repeat protein
MLICLIGISRHGFAQKSKRVKKQRPISEKALQEAEYLFTEGQKYFMLEDYAKALVLYDKCLELNPQNATTHYKIAEIHTKSEDFQTAVPYALKAIALDGDNKYYYLLAANIYNQQGKHADAAVIYETMLGKIEGTENYYFDLAAIYLYQKRYDDALSAYDRAEEVLGIDEDISHQKQQIYLQTNQLHKAIAEIEKLIAHYPEQSHYSVSLANVFSANGQDNKAIDLLTDLLKLHPNDGQALLMLAELQKKSGDLNAYQNTLDKVYKNVNIDPNIKIQLIAENTYALAQARTNGNPNLTLENKTLEQTQALAKTYPENAHVFGVHGDLLYAIDRKEEALQEYIRSLKLDDSNFQVWQNILQIESDMGAHQALIDHADAALEIFPNQSVVYMYAGLAHLQLENYTAAASTLEQGKKLSVQNPSQIAIFSSLLGSAYNGSKEYQKSDNAYQKALDINPQDHQTLNNYSYFLSLRAENLEIAEQMAKKVVTMSPNNATYLDTYAWVLYKREKYKEAKIQIEKAIAIGDPVADNFDHYGDILFRMGQIDEAVTQWIKARELDQSIDHIDKKIETRSIHE